MGRNKRAERTKKLMCEQVLGEVYDHITDVCQGIEFGKLLKEGILVEIEESEKEREC